MDNDEIDKLGQMENDGNQNKSQIQSNNPSQPVKMQHHGMESSDEMPDDMLDLDDGPKKKPKSQYENYKHSLDDEEEMAAGVLNNAEDKIVDESPNFNLKPGDPQPTIRYPETSLYLLDSKSQLRIMCVYIINNKKFEFVLTLCIVINSINIAYGDYSWRAEPNGQPPSGDFRSYLGQVITFIFIGEFFIKVIGMGFLLGKGAYLGDNWNKLDFIVVVTGIYGMLGLEGTNNASALRTIRLLRPLRSINKVRGIRVIVTSLIESMPPLANVALFLLFIIILFGTFGLHLFTNMFEKRCRFGDAPQWVNYTDTGLLLDNPYQIWPHDPEQMYLCGQDENRCTGNTTCGDLFLYPNIKWDPKVEVDVIEFNYYYTNFDNIWESMLTIFQCMTGEGWSKMMYIMSDKHNAILVAAFFSFLILFGVFFVLNLFLAVISDSFSKVNQAEDNEENKKEEDKEKIATLFKLNASQIRDIQNQQKIKQQNQSDRDKEENDFFKGNKKGSQTQQQKNNKNQLQPENEELNIEKEGNDKEQSEQQLLKKKGGNIESDGEGSSSGEEINSTNSQDYVEIISKKNWALIVTETTSFTVVSFILIFGNTIVLACDYYQMSISLNAMLKTMNVSFTYIFTVEMCFKIYAYGIKGYAKEGFNLFDGVLVVVSLFDLVIETIMGQGSGAGVISAFRTLRLLRVFKLAKKLKGLQILLAAIFSTLKDIVYFSLLLALYIFICALLGMEFYAYEVKMLSYNSELQDPVDVKLLTGVTPRLNFNDLGSSLITVFALLVNEDWNMVLYNYVRCGHNGKAKALGYGYIGFVVVIGNFILLQLFLAILIDNFSDASEQALQDQQDEDEKILAAKEAERELRIKEGKSELKQQRSIFQSISSMIWREKTQEEKDQEELKQRKRKQDQYDPLCKSVLAKKSMWQSGVKKEGDEDEEAKEEEADVSKSPILYHIMQRRKNSQYHSKKIAIIDSEDTKPQGNSLWCLKSDYKIRQWIFKLSKDDKFDGFVIICILVSTCSLVFQSNQKDPESTSQIFFGTLDLITTIIFTMECGIKILAYGFLFNGPNSYLQQWSNVFDFFIVLSALLSMQSGGGEGGGATSILGKLKTLRVLRVIRPLRLISRSVQLKIAINALVVSIPQICNLLVFCLLFFFLFGIFGVSKLKGAYYYCDTDHINILPSVNLPIGIINLEVLNTAQDCMDFGGDWIVKDSNFDNIFQAMSTMFKVSLTEGWLDIMFDGIDQRGPEKLGKIDNNLAYGLFFCFFIVVGAFFILNLFDGIVIDNFNNERNKHLGLEKFNSKQRTWMQLQAYVSKIRPKIEVPKPTVKWQALIHAFVHTNQFEGFILSLILVNMVIFMMHTHDQSDLQAEVFEKINLGFLVIFLMEAALKLSCMGKLYFKDPYNVFDFSIMGITVFSMLLALTGLINLKNQTSILRVFRLGRVLRLINKAQSLRMIFNTFLITLPALANIGLLLLLIQFIYTILGVEIFWQLKRQVEINEYANFETFSTSFMTLFRVSTGEGWNFIMDDMLRDWQPNYICKHNITSYKDIQEMGQQGCGNWVAYPYMISYQFIFAIIVINLFVAVILEGFEDTSRLEDANLSDIYLENYTKQWGKYDSMASGLIKVQDLIYFLCTIQLPFKCESVYMLMMKMYLPIIQKNPVEGERNQNYFLFSDIISAITHVSTEENIREEDLRKMNMKNKLQFQCESQRRSMLKSIQGAEQTAYDSSYYILIKKVTKCWQLKMAQKKRLEIITNAQKQQKNKNVVLPPLVKDAKDVKDKEKTQQQKKDKKIDGG